MVISKELEHYNMEIKYRYYKERIKDMHNKGYSPIQIEKEIPIKVSTIKAWLTRMKLTPNRFNKTVDVKHSTTWDGENNTFIAAYNDSTCDLEIANKLNISRRHVTKIRNSLGLSRKVSSVKTPTKESMSLKPLAESALIGCLLGDGYLNMRGVNAAGGIAHSVKQIEYIKHKHNLFSDIASDNITKCIYTSNRFKQHEGVRFNFLANPYLNQFYDNLYLDNVKVISEFFLSKYNNISLAYHFMDDGTKLKSGYSIGTYGFSRSDVKKLSNHLRNNMGLKTTIRKDNTIYIKKESVKLFDLLVIKYIVPSMKYKLHNRNAILKQGEFMGTPEVDNHELSLSSNTLESATTRGRHVTDDAAVSNSSTSALPQSANQAVERLSDDIVCPANITPDSKG